MPVSVVQKVHQSFFEFVRHDTSEGVRLLPGWLTLYCFQSTIYRLDAC